MRWRWWWACMSNYSWIVPKFCINMDHRAPKTNGSPILATDSDSATLKTSNTHVLFKSNEFKPPVTISLSDRLGHFFFNLVFDPVRQWPYHGLTDQVFFIFFFKHIFNPKHHWPYHSLIDQLKQPRSVRPWYGHWRTGVKCLRKKPWSDRPWYGR